MKMVPQAVRKTPEYIYIEYKVLDREDTLHTLECYLAHYEQTGNRDAYDEIVVAIDEDSFLQSVYDVEIQSYLFGNPVEMGSTEMGAGGEMGGYLDRQRFHLITEITPVLKDSLTYIPE